MKVKVIFAILVGLVLAKRSAHGDIQANIRKLIRADHVEKCRAKFIDPAKIKTVENEGRIKIRDPWQMHKCCKSDSCGSPTKFYSYNKERTQCQLVIIRNVCPEIKDTLLKTNDFLNLFQSRDLCIKSCKTGGRGTTFNRQKNKVMNELSDEFSPRTEDRSRSPLPIFGLHRGGFGLHRGPGSINSYIQNYKDYYAAPRRPKEPEQYVNEMWLDVAASENPCSQPQDDGTPRVRGRQTLWFFDENQNHCFIFTYKGAGGNGNRFENYDDCMRTCFIEQKEIPDTARDLIIDISEYDLFDNSFCQDEPPTQMCGFASIETKYYYDASLQKCQIYFASGCQKCPADQCNSFDTKENCKSTCMTKN